MEGWPKYKRLPVMKGGLDRRERYWFPECSFYVAGVEDKKGGWGA
jgi:hypothetical protein